MVLDPNYIRILVVLDPNYILILGVLDPNYIQILVVLDPTRVYLQYQATEEKRHSTNPPTPARPLPLNFQFAK